MKQTLLKVFVIILPFLLLLQGRLLFAQTCETDAIGSNQISSAQIICNGQTPMALQGTIPTGGNGLYSYQWQYSISSSSDNFISVQGVNTQNCQPQTAMQTIWFRRIATSGCQQSISNVVKIEVIPSPAKPSVNNVAVSQGSSATLTVISPQADLSYRWFKTNTGSSLLSTGPTYHTSAITKTEVYYVEAINASGCMSARTALTVTVNSVIENNTILNDQTICKGNSVSEITGSVPYGASGTYIYQWEKSIDGVNFTTIPEAAAPGYTPDALTVTTWFRRKVSAESFDPNTSNVVKITVLENPEAPLVVSSDACEGYRARLSISKPNPELTYRWYMYGHDTDAVEGNSVITVPITTDTVYFIEAVNAAGCSSIPTKLVVRVTAPVMINAIGSPQQICAATVPGQLGGLAPKGGSMLYDYVWEFSTDGLAFMPVPNLLKENSKYYQPEALTQTTWFRRKIVSEFCPTDVSEPVKITVLPAPQKPSITQGATTLTASILGVMYEWLKNGVKIENAQGQSINIDEAGSYSVRVQNEQGCFSYFSEPLQATPQPSALKGDAVNRITVSPNPTTGIIILQAPEDLVQANVKVYSMTGKMVHIQKNIVTGTRSEIDLTKLPNGVYTLHITSKDGTLVSKVIISR